MGLPHDKMVRQVSDELARRYPGHIETRPNWMLSLAGGVMGIMTVLHGSLSEYVLIFGTPVGSEGFSGRYRIEIHDFMLAGEMWTYTESDFAERRVYRAGDPGNPLALELSESGDAENATRAHPDDWRAWVLLADRAQNDPAAIARAVRLAPDNAAVLSRLAWAENFAGRRKKAIEHARRANELAPGRSIHLDTLASLLAGAGQCSEAILLEQRAIEVLPDTAPANAAGELRARLSQMEQKCHRAPSRVEMAEGDADTKPVRKSCGQPPQLDAQPKGPITAEYTVREDGSVGEISMTGNAGAEVLRAFRAFVKSCSYLPAMRGGKPVSFRIKQDLSFARH